MNYPFFPFLLALLVPLGSLSSAPLEIASEDEETEFIDDSDDDGEDPGEEEIETPADEEIDDSSEEE